MNWPIAEEPGKLAESDGIQILKDRDCAVELDPGLTDEDDASCPIGLEVPHYIVRLQEQKHPTACLIADARALALVTRPRQEDARFARARRRYDHPALSRFRQAGVFDQRHSDFFRIEGDRLIVIANHGSDETQVLGQGGRRSDARRRA